MPRIKHDTSQYFKYLQGVENPHKGDLIMTNENKKSRLNQKKFQYCTKYPVKPEAFHCAFHIQYKDPACSDNCPKKVQSHKNIKFYCVTPRVENDLKIS